MLAVSVYTIVDTAWVVLRVGIVFGLLVPCEMLWTDELVLAKGARMFFVLGVDH